MGNKNKSPQDKVNKIRESYNFFSYPERNILNYVEKTGNVIFRIAYEAYCELKHYNSSVFDYTSPELSGSMRNYSEENLKGQAISLLGIVLYYTNQMIQQWIFEVTR